MVLGASGATGRLLVQLLLQKGVEVVALVRNADSLMNIDPVHPGLQIVEAGISELSASDLARHLAGCEAVLSCLGHNLTFKGMFGHPRRLVTDAVQKAVQAIESLNADRGFKIILMISTGVSNRDIPEKPPLSQRAVVFLLRWLLPPHSDNEQAADFLRLQVGQSKDIEWVAVRPDGLVDEDKVSQYNLKVSPVRNVIFDAGKTSRINVADFMSDLAIRPELWNEWKGMMPVIYNDK